MAVTAHLETLTSKKENLDQEINFEMKRPLPNFLKLSELKTKKLAIKTQIIEMIRNDKSMTSMEKRD